MVVRVHVFDDDVIDRVDRGSTSERCFHTGPSNFGSLAAADFVIAMSPNNYNRITGMRFTEQRH